MLPPPSKVGRRPLDRRQVLNAIFYVVRTGCQWRQLPRDFPKWKSIYTIFWRWRQAGFWQRIHDALHRQVRCAAGKDAEPSTAMTDSQSTDTAEGGEVRGDDAGKKITGRKRHIVVDTLGLIIAVVVHGADWQDDEGACDLLIKLRGVGPRIQRTFADSGYGRNGLPDWVHETFGGVLQVVLRPAGAFSDSSSCRSAGSASELLLGWSVIEVTHATMNAIPKPAKR